MAKTGEHREGEVKNVLVEKGFGFIHCDDGSEWFFHRSALRLPLVFPPAKGTRVTFLALQSDKGPRAEEVKEK